jgi:hypothetical protein
MKTDPYLVKGLHLPTELPRARIKAICANCAYFEADPDEGSPSGLCRRHAPHPIHPTADMDGLEAFWPRVDAAEWCGEFRADLVGERKERRGPA